MQFRKSIIVLSALCALLVVTLVIGLVIRNVETGAGPSYDFVAGLSKDAIASIKVTYQGTTTELAKKAQVWSVNYETSFAKAKTSRIDEFLGAIMRLQSERLVSSSKSSHEQLKVNDALAYKLELANSDGSLKKVLYFGDQVAQGSSQYVREPQSDSVYTTAAGLSFDLQQKSTYWADKAAWPSEIAEGKAIEISYSSKETGGFTVDKSTKDGVDLWSSATKPGLDEGAVSSWVRGITTLEGDSMVMLEPGKVPAEYASDSIQITVKGSNSSSAVEVYKAKDVKNDNWLIVSKDHNFKLENGQEFGMLAQSWKVKADLFIKK